MKQFSKITLIFFIIIICSTKSIALSEPTCAILAHQTHPCLLSFAELPDYLLKPNIKLVDSRSPAKFSELHLNSAFNIPLYSIKAKEYLKSSPLLLLGDGPHQRQALATCAELNEKGFNAKFLPNHIAAWSAREGAKQDFSFNLPDLANNNTWPELSISDLLYELSDPDINQRWLVINLGLEEPLVNSPINIQTAPEQGKLSIKNLSFIKNLIGSKALPIDQIWLALILPGQTTSTAELEIWLQELSPYNTFKLLGNLDSIKSYLETHKKINLHLEELKKPKICGAQ